MYYNTNAGTSCQSKSMIARNTSDGMCRLRNGAGGRLTQVARGRQAPHHFRGRAGASVGRGSIGRGFSGGGTETSGQPVTSQ